MSGTVDFNRPYGEVFGEASHRFEQDGKCFDAQGLEVGSPVVEQKATRAYTKRAKPEEAAPSPVDAELNAQMQG